MISEVTYFNFRTIMIDESFEKSLMIEKIGRKIIVNNKFDYLIIRIVFKTNSQLSMQ